MRSLLLFPVGIALRLYMLLTFVLVYFDRRKKLAAAQARPQVKRRPETA